MRPPIRFLFCLMVSVVLPLTFVPSILLTGCGATPETRQSSSYKTLKSVQLAVDAAMKVYGTAVVTGRVSVEKQAEIDAKHGHYREAFRLTAQAARNDLNAIPSADLQRMADELQRIISSL